MRTTLTIEQSAELIKRGVSPERATRVPLCATSPDEPRWSEPIFTLADLFAMLPKDLYGEETDYCDCELHIHANKLGWSASYMEIRGSEVAVMKLTSYGFELIDALFSLVCKLLDNHVKLD